MNSHRSRSPVKISIIENFSIVVHYDFYKVRMVTTFHRCKYNILYWCMRRIRVLSEAHKQAYTKIDFNGKLTDGAMTSQ
jgi:hypothetical protein